MSKKSRYKPKQFHKGGRISDRREMWVRLGHFEWIMYRIPESEQDEEEVQASGGGDAIRILVRQGGIKRLAHEMTSMTTAELDAWKEFLDKMYEAARPICETRDEAAREAFEDGDDSYHRIYREVPRVIQRERSKREHDKGVSDRPGISAGSDGDADPTG